MGEGVEGHAAGDVIFSGNSCEHRQYFAAPATAGKLIAKLPDSIDPRHAALFGMASVGMHDVRRANVAIGENVLVIGAGSIGQFTAQASRLAGAVVTICDLNEKRLEVAGSTGAHHTVAVTEDAESWDAVRQAGPFDVVFEDSGAPILDIVIGTNWCQGVLKHRSRVVMIAGRERVDYSFNAAQGCELSLFHAGHFDRDDLMQVCRFAAEGVLKIDPVIQDVVKIDKAIDIYDTLRDDPGSLFGVVFDWT